MFDKTLSVTESDWGVQILEIFMRNSLLQVYSQDQWSLLSFPLQTIMKQFWRCLFLNENRAKGYWITKIISTSTLNISRRRQLLLDAHFFLYFNSKIRIQPYLLHANDICIRWLPFPLSQCTEKMIFPNIVFTIGTRKIVDKIWYDWTSKLIIKFDHK